MMTHLVTRHLLLVTRYPLLVTRHALRVTQHSLLYSVAFLLTGVVMSILMSGCIEDNGISAPQIIDVNLSGEWPLIYRMDIILDKPAEIILRYGRDLPNELETRSEESATNHSLIISQLVSNATYSYLIEAGEVVMYGDFTTGSLPEDLAAVEFRTTGSSTHPLVLVKLFQPDGFNGYAVINSDGDVVWYYRTEGRSSGATRRTNGNFVFIDSDRGLVEVTPTGIVLSLLPQDPTGRDLHHDVISGPPGEILFLARDPHTVDDELIAGEAIWEWIPETNVTRKLWSSFDHLSPVDDWGPRSQNSDWLHANSLSLGPRGNVLVSLHYLNQVISIAPDFQSLEWRLGGLNATIHVNDDDMFTGQHTAAETAPGNVLIFDNGFEREEAYSRAVEFRLTGDRAEKVWEFRPSRDNWSRIISSARRLDNGNTFVTFGVSEGLVNSSGPIEAYEVTRSGDIVWHMEAEGSISSMYRATPIETLAGERSILK
jgi:hypothetical protein